MPNNDPAHLYWVHYTAHRAKLHLRTVRFATPELGCCVALRSPAVTRFGPRTILLGLLRTSCRRLR